MMIVAILWFWFETYNFVKNLIYTYVILDIAKMIDRHT